MQPIVCARDQTSHVKLGEYDATGSCQVSAPSAANFLTLLSTTPLSPAFLIGLSDGSVASCSGMSIDRPARHLFQALLDR